jgi:serine/threonine-protein kinase
MQHASIPDRFEVLDEIAHGEGEVLLRARDTLLQREVILRRPAPGLAHTWPDSGMRAAELRSVRALAQVRHKCVVRLLDVLETPQGVLVVLEPVVGETLAEILAREKRLEPARVQQLGRELAGALAAVHNQGVVHRGISSANIVVRRNGEPCLFGFGFAKFIDRAAGQSSIHFRDRAESSARAALPPHPAPEQVVGRAADARSDLFALGWVLYEALTGRAPYPHDREPEEWTEPVDPTQFVPATPRSLSQALLCCLKRDPGQRFESAADLAQALEVAVAPSSRPAIAQPRRTRLAPILSGAGIALAAVVGALALRGQLGGPTHAADPGFASTDGERGLARIDDPIAKSAGTYSDGFTQARALLIGIGDYSGTGWKDLPNARCDVESLAERLEEMKPWDGWQVKTLIDKEATKVAIKEALTELAEGTRDPESRVFLYFAGHGARDELSSVDGFIVPADAKPRAEDKSRESYLLYQDGFDIFFNRTLAKHVLLAMDCCYGGGVTQLRGDVDQPTDLLLRRRAHIIFASTLRDEAASDGVVGEHSPFAQAFLDALRDPNRSSVTSSELGSRITDALRRVPQTPNLGYRPGGGNGQFVFFTQRP